MIKIFGIKNCDTMKKTFKWFDENNINYEFHDYKKQPPTADLANAFLAQHPWEIIINKRGTTWRKLDDSTKADMDAETSVAVMINNPSIIKRPIVEYNGQLLVGFNTEQFKQLT